VPLGISVVIPCFNGADRLPRTLAHIAAQHVPQGLEWEVVLVDNASTDGTPQAAARAWPAPAPAPLRIVSEPRLGLSFAHLAGFAAARHEIVTFVEDDNWIAPDWLQVVSEVMETHPDVGACGGRNEAHCSSPPPAWFESCAHYYAVGAQGPERGGDITWTRGFLWGAGMTVRAAAWRQLVEGGFRFLLEDRVGDRLKTGGDSELSFALRLAGWKLGYEPRLRLRHDLPPRRLRWPYLRELVRGMGAASAGLEPYLRVSHDRGRPLAEALRVLWFREALADALRLAARPAQLLRFAVGGREGNPGDLEIARRLGRIAELLRSRSRFDRSVEALRGVAWRRVP
jgi:glycosyltransferase involved in cell wall biosynthesis